MQIAVERGLRVLMLATDAHGGYGGIAQYNRDVIEAMCNLQRIDSIIVLPRVMPHMGFEAPAKASYDVASAKGTISFVSRSAAQAFQGGRFDLVYCAHLNLLSVAAAVALSRRIPLVLAIYGIDAWQPPSGYVTRWAIRAVSLVISISQITLERFKAWSGVDAGRCAILPNAIHTAKFGIGRKDSPLSRRLRVMERPVVLTFGRMSADERYKGFDEVIEAIPRLTERVPRLLYVAAGDGSDRVRLQTKAKSLGVDDCVIFTGHVSEEEKAALYHLADAYVMPSSGEGFGFVVLEAMASGIPVVASSIDGTREAVRGGELGRVVDPKDQDALTAAILEALSKPKVILPGLEYFSFANFQNRLQAALADVLAI